MPLEQPQAKQRLRRMVQADATPTLDLYDIDDLLDQAKRRDRFGLYPSEDGWEPTWNLHAAAAEGWRWKAGKAASGYGFTADGATLNRQHVHEHCLRMIEHHSALAVQSSGVHDRDVGPMGGRVIANG